MTDIQDFITQALKQAGQICLESFGAIQSVSTKQDQSNIVTQTDIKIENFLASQILRHFPQDTIIGEETGFHGGINQFQWTVDPIDGTSNYASGLPWFGIIIARLENWLPINAGIYLPSLDELYLAAVNKIATLNGKPIQVTGEAELKNVLVSYGIDYSSDEQKTNQELSIIRQLVKHSRNFRCTNSVYDDCAVATGKYGAFLNQACKIWDVTPAYLLIKQAGGEYTDIGGQPLDFSCTPDNYLRNFTFLAASKPMHQKIIEILND